MATVNVITYSGSTFNFNCATSLYQEVTLGGNNHNLTISNDAETDCGFLFVKQPSGNHYDHFNVPSGDIISGGDGTQQIKLPQVNGAKTLCGFIRWKSTWRIWTISAQCK